MRSVGFECSAKIPETDHKRHGFSRARIEAQGDVEPSRLLGDCVDNDAPNPDGIGRLSDTARGVAKHGAPQSTSLVTEIHRQPGQDHDRDGIRHISSELTTDDRVCDSARGECVVADDAFVFTDYVGPGGATRLVRAGATSEPFVYCSFTRSKGVNLMVLCQRLRSRKRRVQSHGAGVRMVLSSRLFGRGGASNFAKNCR